jgi:glycosyltransferase involved in cell wall biosynthesis
LSGLRSNDDVLRIVSSSNIIPLKRIALIAQALSQIDFKVEWTHLGDGKLFHLIKDIIQHLPENITVNLPGRVKPEEVLNFYILNSVELFLNVSTTEGVPVSIMEAFSAGIPVYATNVGGTSEIVNSGNGKLMEKDLTPEKLAHEIRSFMDLTSEKRLALRKNALETYSEKCDFHVLTKQLITLIDS